MQYNNTRQVKCEVWWWHFRLLYDLHQQTKTKAKEKVLVSVSYASQRDIRVTSDSYRFCGQKCCLILKTHLSSFGTPVITVNYKTVSLSMTSSSVREDFSDLFWNFFSFKSPFLRQTNMSKINSPTVSMPPAEKKVAWYDLVLSATKPEKGNMNC